MTHKTKGIVLRSIKYGETSLVVTIFTALFGVQVYLVNGARSQKKSGNKSAMFQPGALLDLDKVQRLGLEHLPVCIAKTQYSFSTDAKLRGAPSGHVVNIREVRLAAGAEFVVMVCGDIMTMPGLPKVPAAELIDIDAQGRISGLS